MRTRFTLLVSFIFFGLAPAVVFAEAQRLGVPRVPRVVSTRISFQGSIDIALIEGGWFSTWHIFCYPDLPVASTVEELVFGPDGTLFSTVHHTVSTGGEALWQGWMWYGGNGDGTEGRTLPAGWPKGLATFQVIVTIYGQKYRVSAAVPVGMPSDTKVGPLDNALVDEVGGVRLLGSFTTPLTVVAPRVLNSPVQLQEGNYIPPKSIGKGPTVITVCSGVRGNTADLECSTVTVQLP